MLSYNAACGRRGGCKKRTERNGCSFVISRGSGVFVPIGRALRVPRKRDASDALQIENPDWAVQKGYDSRPWCKHARKLGFDSVVTRVKIRDAPVGLPNTVRWMSLCYAQVSALAGMDAARAHQHPCAQA